MTDDRLQSRSGLSGRGSKIHTTLPGPHASDTLLPCPRHHPAASSLSEQVFRIYSFILAHAVTMQSFVFLNVLFEMISEFR